MSEHNRTIVVRNINVRLALLELTKAELAGIAGMSKQAFHQRLAKGRLDSRCLRWLATLLVVTVDHLTNPNPVMMASAWIPPDITWQAYVKAVLSRYRTRLASLPSYTDLVAGISKGDLNNETHTRHDQQ